jgi:hypothetical protein
MGPPPGNQAPDIIIPVSTLNTNLVYRVSGRDGRLYQAYLGVKLSSTNDMEQMRMKAIWLIQPSVQIIFLNRQ